MSVAATRPRVVPGPVRARMRWGLLAWAAAVTAVMLLPLVYLGVRASEAEAASWELILRSRTAWLALRSVGLAAVVTGSAAIIGVPLAWLTARTDLPNRRLWSVAVALPLVFPSYVGAFALIAALGPRGMLQELLEGPLGVTALPDISGFVGAWLALTLFTYPYVYLMAAAGIRGLDPACEEVARSLGRSSWTTFWRVTLPQLRPSVAAGCLLVALYTLHDFGAVSLMRFQAFTQAIYLQYRGAFDRAPAAILSLMLVLLALGVLVMERRARGRARYFRAGPGSRRPVRPVALGRWKWPALALCGAVAGAALVLPLGVISFWLARGVLQGSGASLSWAAAGASVLVSSMGAVVAVAAAVPVALLAARHEGPTTAVVERLAYSGYALPGIVVALAFVFAAANFAPALYQSVPLVVIAYMVLFLPQAVEPLRTSLLQVGPRAEEAARALGVTKAQTFRRVVAPLVGRGAMAGAALVFLTSMKELPATLLLRPTGFETLATRVWTGATAGLYSKAAAPAWLLILICAVPLYFLTRRIEVEEAQ